MPHRLVRALAQAGPATRAYWRLTFAEGAARRAFAAGDEQEAVRLAKRVWRLRTQFKQAGGERALAFERATAKKRLLAVRSAQAGRLSTGTLFLTTATLAIPAIAAAMVFKTITRPPRPKTRRRRPGRPPKAEREAPAPPPARPCRCDHPLVFADEWLGPIWCRCLLCGHDAEAAS